MKSFTKISILFTLLFFSYFDTLTGQENNFFKAPGSPLNPKIKQAWNVYLDYKGVTDLCKTIANTFPNLVTLESIGKTYENRDLWVLTITDKSIGNFKEKPGFYIDGNIHSNEVQGCMVSLYTAWYLVENFGKNEFITNLLKKKTFYILPNINPDGSENYMKSPNSMHSPRSGVLPIDDDGDGLFDEDLYDDLDNDGNICYMRRKNPMGKFKIDPHLPNYMVQVPFDQFGDYEYLGEEGIDNDGDGLVNEDRIGIYDPNRDWGWGWQPEYIQNGTYRYPFSLPETQAIRDFVISHPNIAGAQTYHNFGGMILRSPGNASDNAAYTGADVQVSDALAAKGEIMLPGYKYMVIHKDLYTLYGGENDWFYGARGIFIFCNELFSSSFYYNKPNNMWSNPEEQLKFDRDFLFNDMLVPWKEFNHPIYGKIEIGGFKKNYTRNNPGFMLESDAHRNMAFTLYHASQMPDLQIQTPEVIDLGDGLKQVTVSIVNNAIIPTHSGQDVNKKIELSDLVIIENAKVIAGMIVVNKDLNLCTEQKQNPQSIKVQNISGMSAIHVRWIIESNSNFNIVVKSKKGGVVSLKK